MADGPSAGARRGAHTRNPRACAGVPLPLSDASCVRSACKQVSAEIPLIDRLCADLHKAYEPKVSVHSAAAFEGKVWE